MKAEQEKIIAQLLAARDGEPFDAQTLAALDQDEQQQLMHAVDGISAQLQELPDVAVDDAVWRQHIPTAKQSRPSAWLRFPIATAASVFLVSAIGIFVLFSSEGPGPGTQDFVVTGDGVNNQGATLANLMNRSRDLEQRLGGMSGWVTAATASAGLESDNPDQVLQTSPAERVLLYRLADVDGQIGRLYESEQVDQTMRLKLWQQRVDLLENLAVMRGARHGMRSIYMNDGRSL